MKVLDLRSCWVRAGLALWRNSRREVPVSSALGSGLGLADAWMARRARGRDAAATGRPWLISIGNLALGGTGKTPVVGRLAADLASRGRRGAILVRGYGSQLPGPLFVGPDTAGAGDEARWHARALADSDWKVCQARSRPDGLRWLLERESGLDYVLLEDAFQTARLPRHLDVLIVDSWRTAETGGVPVLRPATGPVFPWGPWRETARGAERADLLLVETTGDAPASSIHGQPVATFARASRLVDPRSGANGAAEPPGGSWAALSGIAHPDRFESGAAALLGSEPGLAVRGGDHQRYDAATVGHILEEMARADAELLVTTAKDWVKLEELWPAGRPVRVVELDLEWGRRNALPDWVEERIGSLSPEGA